LQIFLALAATICSAAAQEGLGPRPSNYRPVPNNNNNNNNDIDPYRDSPPQPYAYKYGVQDVHTGASFDKQEEQDGYGNLQGSYRVNLPDGRVQVVTYRATAEGGYKADVTYEGEAVYPPEPAEGYGNSYKKYSRPSQSS
jgi:hypothetical protein